MGGERSTRLSGNVHMMQWGRTPRAQPRLQCAVRSEACTAGAQGWPSLLFMVYSRNDTSNKDAFVSYGVCALPTCPGVHHLTCRTWHAEERDRVSTRRVFGAQLL